MVVLDVEGYLERLGVAPGPPSLDQLFALHRAHVSRVPWETLEIQLGRPTTVDPHESAARIIAGRGGYCFHLNGGFAALLDALGYPVTWHVATVYGGSDPAGTEVNHLALTVVADNYTWYADVGLGDALFEPMPLRVGEVQQGPFRYRLERSPKVSGGWRFRHDPAAGSFTGMDFAPRPAGPDDFAEAHIRLSTAATSEFVRVAHVANRTADALTHLRGCVLTQVSGAGRVDHEITGATEWFDTVRDTFGMPLDDVDGEARDRLWRRLWAAHTAHRART